MSMSLAPDPFDWDAHNLAMKAAMERWQAAHEAEMAALRNMREALSEARQMISDFIGGAA